jgi:branched-chain amino acid transport system permease protein
MAEATAGDSQVAAGPGTAWRVPLLFWAVVGVLALLGAVITDSYIQHVLILCFLWCIVAAAWDLALGYAGVFNYAQLVFFAAGAYATSMLALKLGVPPVPAIIAASVIAGLVGLLVGLPCLRLKGEYVALFTFAVHLAMPPLIQQTKALGSGGTMGLFGVPPINLFGIVFTSQNKIAWYFLTLIAAALCVHVIYFVLLRSKTGRAFVALRDSEHFARSLGVNELKYKLLAFTLSAVITGFAGALYAHYTSVVTPKILGNEFFLLVMVMLAIGGIGRFPGAVMGAMIVTILNELLRSTGTFRLLILGLLVVFTLLLLPNGMVSLRQQWTRITGRMRS